MKSANRQIVLDTETTGLEYRLGHRVIEIGGIEMVGRRPTGKRFHRYLNPGRAIDAGAVNVHGLTDEFLADKPKFADIVGEFVDFVAGAELVIHNAPFDTGFLDNELGLLGKPALGQLCAGVLDTLKMARDQRPGKKNSLDALCRDFGVDNSGRQLHGALLDAELLAEVYLAMTRGQESLVMDVDMPAPAAVALVAGVRPPLLVQRASEAELAEHERVLGEIAKESKGKCLWQSLTAPA